MQLRDVNVRIATMVPDTSMTHLFLHLERENAKPTALAILSLALAVKNLLEDHEHFLDDKQIALLLRDYHPSLRSYTKENRPSVDDGFGSALGFLLSSDVCADIELDSRTFITPLSGFGFTIRRKTVSDSRVILEAQISSQETNEQEPKSDAVPQENVDIRNNCVTGEESQNNQDLRLKDNDVRLLRGELLYEAITMKTPCTGESMNSQLGLVTMTDTVGRITSNVVSGFGVVISSFFLRVFDRGKLTLLQDFRSSIRISNCV